MIKDIPGYEDLYAITEDGRVWRKQGYSCLKGRWLNTSRRTNSGKGYQHAALSKDGKVKSKTVHRMVAVAFVPNPENKPCVNHIDGDKTNNHYTNLEWVTYSENTLHAFRTGLLVHREWKKEAVAV